MLTLLGIKSRRFHCRLTQLEWPSSSPASLAHCGSTFNPSTLTKRLVGLVFKLGRKWAHYAGQLSLFLNPGSSQNWVAPIWIAQICICQNIHKYEHCTCEEKSRCVYFRNTSPPSIPTITCGMNHQFIRTSIQFKSPFINGFPLNTINYLF